MDATTDSHSYSEDEISLIDLWGVLLRRKAVLGAVVALCLAAAVAVAVLKSDKYIYATTLEIGAVLEDEKQVFIDTPDTVLSKIKEGYIPAVLNEYAKTANDADEIEISVRVPKNSTLVVMESKGKETQGDVIKILERQVIERVLQDHGRIIDVTKRNIVTQVDKLMRHNDGLKDQQKVLINDKERIKVISELVERQLAGVKAMADDAAANRKSVRSNIGDETRAMTLLMIDNEINQHRERVAELEERLHVALPDEKDNLEKALADNLRAQANNQADIEKLNLTLKNIRETRAIIEPTQSLKPTGVSKPLIVVLGAVLGLFLGIFAAFFAEFLAKAREQLKGQAG